jgi:hypothetical protein
MQASPSFIRFLLWGAGAQRTDNPFGKMYAMGLRADWDCAVVRVWTTTVAAPRQPRRHHPMQVADQGPVDAVARAIAELEADVAMSVRAMLESFPESA